MPTYTAKQYSNAAAQAADNARRALHNARRARIAGLIEFAAMYTNNAARYRRAYTMRKRQAQDGTL